MKHNNIDTVHTVIGFNRRATVYFECIKESNTSTMTSILQQLNVLKPSKTSVDTLLGRLEKNVSKLPDKQALAFLGSGSDGGVIEAKLTYKDVWDETMMLAENLLTSGMKKGDM